MTQPTTTEPYTDEDLRREAARQYAEVLRNPDRLEVQDETQGTLIPSRDIRWGQLSGDDWHDAVNSVHELLEDAPDLSRWAIDLGACGLRRTTELAWGHPGNWDLAVQIAHRPGIADDLHDALVNTIRGAVNLVLSNRGLDLPSITDQQTEQEA